ncbi:MAG TPA: response regulator transcription factor [Candidatus Limnocylindrales bacterium]|nr:response regulator transcription factor [Candidatus Limnocylindrales bacterium]
MTKTTVLIVEDHPLLADALKIVLERDGTFEVVAMELNVAGGLASAASLRPNLALLDQHLPDGKGTDIARRIRRDQLGSAVVLLTGDASDDTLLAALEAGVAGFIPKSEPVEQIVELLKRAVAGEIVIPGDDLVRLLRNQREREREKRERDRVAETLTPRDRQVLDLMSEGLDTREMADRTGLAINTIRGQVQMIIEKLQTHSRLEAVVRAASLGIVRRAGEAGV